MEGLCLNNIYRFGNLMRIKVSLQTNMQNKMEMFAHEIRQGLNDTKNRLDGIQGGMQVHTPKHHVLICTHHFETNCLPPPTPPLRRIN
jgi:hypothetical protein